MQKFFSCNNREHGWSDEAGTESEQGWRKSGVTKTPTSKEVKATAEKMGTQQ